MTGIEVVGVVLAIPALIELCRHTLIAIQDCKALPKRVSAIICQIERHLRCMESLLHQDQGYLVDPLVQDTVKEFQLELKTIREQCEAYCSERFCLRQRLIRRCKGKDLARQVSALHENIMLTYNKWQVDIQARTSAQIEEFERIFVEEAAIIRSNMSGLAGGLNELQENMRCFVEAFMSLQPDGTGELRNTATPSEIPDSRAVDKAIISSEVEPTADQSLLQSRFSALMKALQETHIPRISPQSTRPLNPLPRDDHTAITYDDAVESCLRVLNSLRHKRPPPPFDLFFSLRHLSRQLVVLSQHSAALDVLRFIEKLLIGFESQLEVPGAFRFDLAATLGSLVPLLAGNNDISEARTVCARALRIAESLSILLPHPILSLLLRVQYALEESQDAKLSLLSRAIDIYELLVNHQREDRDVILVRLAETFSSRGRLLLKVNRPTDALQDLKRAKKMFEHLGATTPEHLGVCLVRLGQTYNVLGYPEEAGKQLHVATQIVDNNATQGAVRPWVRPLRNELRRAMAGETVPGSIRLRTLSISVQVALRSLAYGSPVSTQFTSVKRRSTRRHGQETVGADGIYQVSTPFPSLPLMSDEKVPQNASCWLQEIDNSEPRPILASLPPFNIPQLPQFKGAIVRSVASLPLSCLSAVAGPGATSSLATVPKENTMDPTEVNQHATQMDSHPHNGQNSSCTCTICRRESHGPFDIGCEEVDQRHGHHVEDFGQGSLRHRLKRCSAMRRKHAGRA